jgi:CheY-like chemotaxis protein
MDIKMPVMNGFEATGIIKSFRKDLPIIAVTAYAMAEDEKIALDAGCDDYLAKPFTYSRLIEKVRKYTS